MSKTLKDFESMNYNEVIENIQKDDNYVFNYIQKDDLLKTNKYIAIKDIHASVNMPVTVSSKVLKDFVAKYDSYVVQTLKEKGYNIVGTLNMDEFAMGGSNTNSAFKLTPNAIDNENIAGGSSGASAYSVAKGLVPFATGTDTGGSVRQPAALNGIFGFKPTYGLISRYGTVSFASSFDTIGTFANSLDDLLMVSKDLINPDNRDQSSFVPKDFNLVALENKKLSDYKVCIIKEFEEIPTDEFVAKEYKEFKEMLGANGVTIEQKSIDTIPYSLDLYIALAYAEASSNLSRYDGIIYGNSDGTKEEFFKNRNLFGEEVKKRLIIGTLMLSSKNSERFFGKAQKVRNKMRQQFEEVFSEYDLVISPSTNKSYIKIGSDTASKEFYLADNLTIPANLTGMPSVSYPLKRNLQANPVGIQIMADKYSDSKIFEFMKLLEEKRND